MEYLPIISVLFTYIESGNDKRFIAALRLIGNISSSEKCIYAENLYKNGFLNSLIIGWNNHNTYDIQREIFWILSNLVSS